MTPNMEGSGGGVVGVEEVAGKGVGVVALVSLEPGRLVLAEEPALWVTPELDGHSETIQAFAEMEPEEQEKLLQLCNMYSMDEDMWTDSMRRELEVCVSEAGDIAFTKVARETAMKVWQIWLTNAYDEGVFLLLSR